MKHLAFLLAALIGTASILPAQILHFQVDGDAEDRLGWSLANAGDIDGDGADDLVVGAPQRGLGSLATSSGPGFVRVYSGSDGALLMQASGEEVGDTFGFSVDGVGDFDGDGIGDVVVGAPQLGQPHRRGYARVVSGADGTTLRHVANSGAFEEAGRVVSGLGDLDDDGTPDFFIAVPYYGSNGIENRGRVMVVSGATGGILASHQAGEGQRLGQRAFRGDFDDDDVCDYAALGNPPNAAPYVRIWSGATRDQITQLPIRTKAQVGDHNGDGVDDFAWNSEVYSGVDGSLLIDFPHTFANYPRLFADLPGGRGDYNGDGVLDLLTTSALYLNSTSAIFDGASGAVSHQLGLKGSGLCDLGDVDGDGFTDFAIARTNTLGPAAVLAGSVRVFRGTPRAPISSFCLDFVSSYGLDFDGTSSFTNNDLQLRVFSLPPNQLGILILGDTQQQVPFGEGDLCVGGNILRLVTPLSYPDTQLILPLDLTQPPFAGSPNAIQPGDTRNFQFWYRTRTGFDLTNALSITFGL